MLTSFLTLNDGLAAFRIADMTRKVAVKSHWRKKTKKEGYSNKMSNQILFLSSLTKKTCTVQRVDANLLAKRLNINADLSSKYPLLTLKFKHQNMDSFFLAHIIFL